MNLAAVIKRHVDACLAEVRGEIEAEIRVALGDGALGGSPPPRTSARPAKAPKVKRAPKSRAKTIVQRDVKPSKSGRTCGCGPVGRHRRECATQVSAKPARKAASDDEDRGAPALEMAPAQEMQPAVFPGANGQIRPFAAPAVVAAPARVRTRRRSTAVTPGPELPVIPHLALVAMLAADRANNAVGDAGGHVLRSELEPSLIGHTETKREHCPVHGWVGRVAFERDGHEHCVSVEAYSSEACAQCHGTGWVTAKMCKRCDGTGEARIEPELDPVPRGVHRDSNPLNMVQATVRIDNIVEVIGLDGEIIRQRRRGARDLRGHERSDTIATKQLTRGVLAEGWAEIAQLDAELGAADYAPRPLTRAGCADVPRPCPYVSCRHHLALDINPEIGSIKLNFPDVEPWELTHSCSLDAADLGPHTLDAAGEKLNVTRERLRQLETKAVAAMQLAAKRARIVPRDVNPDNESDEPEPEQGATTP